MSRSDYTVEDFVLDPEFRKWVLDSDEIAKIYWENYLRENPSKYREVKLARKLLLNMSREVYPVSSYKIDTTWENIEKGIEKVKEEDFGRRVVPLHSWGTLEKHKATYSTYSAGHQFYRLVGILVIAFTLAIVINVLKPQKLILVAKKPLIYEEQYSPPGVKSNLTLQDGSKVTLNSGSSLRYIKNFETDKRELELIGEAYFEVAKDSLRPFIVKTASVTTKALGTSFNIKAYDKDDINISLLTGLVKVSIKDQRKTTNLIPGEVLKINLNKHHSHKQEFEEETVLAWTRETISFDHAPINEVFRVLENWYGVQIEFNTPPKNNLDISGVFRDQTLENVLQGLSYSCRFEYVIEKDKVTLTFK